MNSFKHLVFLCLVISSIFTSCTKDTEIQGELFWVNKARVHCVGFIEQTCYEVKKGKL